MIDSAIHFLFPDGKWNQVWVDSPQIPVEWRDGHAKTEYNCSDGKVAITYAWDQFVDTHDPPGTRLRAFLLDLGIEVDQITDGIKTEGSMSTSSGVTYEARWLEVFEASASSGRTREAISTRTCEEIFTICMRNQVPCGRFLEGQQVFDDPQVRHNGTIVPQQHPVGGRFVTPKPPAVFHGTPSAIGAPAPLLGTDSEELLAEFGYTEAEIVRMQSDGLV